MGKNQFSILKNRIWNILGILSIPRNIWLLSLDFYNFEDFSDLKNLPWMNYNSPILFPWWLKQAIFLLDASIFTTIDEKKEEQQSTQIFLKDVTERKKVEIHKHS